MPDLILWGVTASPYLLKMQALADYSDLDWQRWPEQATRLGALRTAWRLERGRRTGTISRFPQMDKVMDEYPAVPYYSPDGRSFSYDSTGLALWLDHSGHSRSPLLPDDPLAAFLAHLIDEAFDEFGLYMVHHMRWVGSARTTDMGKRTAREMRKLLPPGMGGVLAGRLYRRQSQRCPYLFSVAPDGFDCGLPAGRTPPPRDGFPATHALLDEAWRDYLAAMESILAEQPYLLGERFSLVDASAYGQLGMNLVDGEATRLLEASAPRTYRWLRAIEGGQHRDSAGELRLEACLKPLLSVIGETFMPLMAQNERAYLAAVSRGETLFNEAAFDAGRALYDGELRGHPFRSVVKTFQVAVWRELRAGWQALSLQDRNALQQQWLGDGVRWLEEARPA